MTSSLETILGHEFKRPDLLREALTLVRGQGSRTGSAAHGLRIDRIGG